MRGIRVLLAAFVLAGGSASTAAAQTTITFDDQPAGTALTTQYAAQGITFQPITINHVSQAAHVQADSAHAHSAPNVAAIAFTPEGGGETRGNLSASFSALQRTVGLFVGAPTATASQTVTLTAYDSSQQPIGASAQVTVSAGEAVDVPLEIDAGSAQIASFTISAPTADAGGAVEVDDLAFAADSGSAAPPAATTGTAGTITTTSATLDGSVDPEGSPASAAFQYGPTAAYGASTPAQPLPADSTAHPITASLTGLAPGTTYHYRVVASGPGGTAYGLDQTFTTASPPPPSPPGPAPAPLRLSGVEGHLVQGTVAHFASRPDSVSIDWGDRTAPLPGQIVADPAGGYEVLAAGRGHAYVEEGDYTATVAAKYGEATETAHTPVHITDAPLTHVSVGTSQYLQANSPTTMLIGEFVDEALASSGNGLAGAHGFNADAYEHDISTTVDWGDGTAPDQGLADTPDMSGEPWAVYGTHSFRADGTYTVTVTLRDKGGATATGTGQIHVVAEPPPDPCPAAYDLGSPDNPDRAVLTPSGEVMQTFRLTHTSDRIERTLTATGCWVSVGDRTDPQWNTRAPVTLDDAVVLYPVTADDPPVLTVDGPSGAISAAPYDGGSGTEYDVGVKQADGSVSVYGRLDLARTPITTSAPLIASPHGPHFGASGITGGELSLGSTGVGLIDHLPLSSMFQTAPAPGPPPTADLRYSHSTALPPTTGGCNDAACQGTGGAGGGVEDPQCVLHPRLCSGPPKLAAADGATAARARERARQAATIDFSASGGRLHLEVSDLYLGALHIQNAFIDHDPDAGLWSGGGDLQLGVYSLHAAPPPPDYGFGIRDDGSLAYGGAALSFGTPGVPIFTGVNLARIGFSFGTRPTRFTGDILVNVAGGLATVEGGVLVVFASPDYTYTYPNCTGDPASCPLPGVTGLQTDTARNPITGTAIGVSGQVTLKVPLLGDVPLAKAYVFYIGEPGGSYFEFAGNLDLSLLSGSLKLSAYLKGALDTANGAYNIGGGISFCAGLPDPIGNTCIRADGLVSSLGVGACVDLGSYPLVGDIDAGFRYPWGGPVTLFLENCYLGPITVNDVRTGRARETAAGFTIPPGTARESINVQGAVGAPRVEVQGPGGIRVDSDADANRIAGNQRVAIFPVRMLHQTLIGITHPPAGRWTITALPGSTPITRVSRAAGLPAAHVTATVTGRGASRILRWRALARPRQTITFVEHGSSVDHQILRTSASSGTVRFHAAVGPAARRQIVAEVSLAGVPSQKLVAGSYRAPRVARPPAPRALALQRAGDRLIVRFGAARAAFGYVVSAFLSDGRRLSFTARRPRAITIRRVVGATSATVRAAALGADGGLGPAAIGRLRAQPRVAAPGRPHVRRARGGVTLSWRPSPGGMRYLATIRIGGAVRVRFTRIPRITLGLAHGRLARVSLAALGSDGRLGARRSVTLRG